MPAGQGSLGRNVILKWNGVKIAGGREKSVTYGGEKIDVTDDDSSGWRELLAEDANKMVDITLSGIIKGDVLRRAKINGGDETIKPMTLEYEDGGILGGDFGLGAYSETGTYNDAATFEASFQSTGSCTYTPAP